MSDMQSSFCRYDINKKESCTANELLKKLCLQHPGHCHLVQRDHHPPDDVQHVRVPGRPGVAASGEVQGPAGILYSLPDP